MSLAQKENITGPDRDGLRDIPPTHWARSTANDLVRVGIIQGDLQGRFNGDAPLKRADFAIVMSRLSARASRGPSPIAIPEWAQEQKGCFTRYEFAVVLSRYSHFLNPGAPPFTDLEAPNGRNEFRDIPQTHWARLAANHVAGFGIIEGDLQGRFNGNALVTRYEFICALLRHSIFRSHDLCSMKS